MKKLGNYFHDNIVAAICYIFVNLAVMYAFVTPWMISYPNNFICIAGFLVGFLNVVHLGKFIINVIKRKINL